MKIQTVKGASDYLPGEAELRDHLQSTILGVYQNHGFWRIMTPIIEDIENLDKSEGGDNLNLIFRIMKRGDKLEKALAEAAYDDLADMGLRYDLTLPLSRYFANNRANLPYPFKCIQTDKAYRAERPQKGRGREFVQCDIDILGSESPDCEIEIIDVTAKALEASGISGFKARISDRRVLRETLLSLGFEEKSLESVSVAFDKLDKIGPEGVEKELRDKGLGGAAADNLSAIIRGLPMGLDEIKTTLPPAARGSFANLEKIIGEVRKLSKGRYTAEFDISLVRGQGYYTGTVFEIESNAWKGSIAGGGRYDDLIGKFLNEKIPAVGFSIGFEKIFSILSEEGFAIPSSKKKIAALYGNGGFSQAYEAAEGLRKNYNVTLYEKPKKTKNFLDQLMNTGYDGFVMMAQPDDIHFFDAGAKE